MDPPRRRAADHRCATVAQLRDNLGCTAITLPPELGRLETETGFSRGFPADFIDQTTSWVLGAAAL